MKPHSLARFGAVVLVLPAAAGCSFAPDPELPTPVAEMPESFVEADEEATTAYAPLEWWRTFEDPVLDALVDTALVFNLDLVEAVGRVEQARAQAGIARADLFPAIQATADRTDQNSPANTGIGGQFAGVTGDSAGTGGGAPALRRFEFTTYSASLGFSWELDFWGRARHDTRAAAADLMASEADLHAARIGVLSETITAYFQAVDLRQRIELTLETVDVLAERETLTRERYDRGLVTSFELYQVRQDLRNAQASLPQLEIQLTDAEGRLAVLIGRFAGRIDHLLGDDLRPQLATQAIDAGIPADLLLQRPDVRAAAERLEAARYRVGARRANLLPTLSLSGSVGRQSSDVDGLFDADQWFSNLITNLTAPIFQGGRLRANVRVAQAQHKQLAAAFGRSVLTAVFEVESALERFEEERQRHAFLTSQREEAAASVSLQAQRFESGVAGYTDYLDALRQLLSVESTLAAASRDLALARLAVHRSLGGGWADPEVEPVLDMTPANEPGNDPADHTVDHPANHMER